MQTVTWSRVVSRSAWAAAGSRWPGTAVVAAVSSVTSLLRAGIRSPPNASNLPPAGHDEKRGAPPAGCPCASLRSPCAPQRPRAPPGARPRACPGRREPRAACRPRLTTLERLPRRRLGLLGLPEDLVDLLDLGQQF